VHLKKFVIISTNHLVNLLVIVRQSDFHFILEGQFLALVKIRSFLQYS